MALSEYMKSRQQKIFGKEKEKKEKEKTDEENTLTRSQLARTPKRPKEDKAPARRGEKLKELFKGYIKLVKIFLSKPENFRCKIQSPVCQGLATCVHHMAGRTGPQLKNEEDWMPVCERCNGFVEENDSWAREKGFKKSRMGKVKKGR